MLYSGTPTKRTNDQPIERAPEPKRPRLQPNTESPKPLPKAANPQPQLIAPVSSHAQPIRPAPAMPQMNTLKLPPGGLQTHLTAGQINDKLKEAAVRISELQTRVAAAKAAGDFKLAEELTNEMRGKAESHARIIKATQMIMAGQLVNGQNPGLWPSLRMVFVKKNLLMIVFIIISIRSKRTCFTSLWHERIW